MKIASRMVLGLLVLCLLAAAYFGLTEGFPLLREARTGVQRLAAWTELLYGVAALASLVALASRLRWTVALLIVWAALVTITAALAPVVWGGASSAAGAESGAAAAIVLAALLIGWHRLCRRGPGERAP